VIVFGPMILSTTVWSSVPWLVFGVVMTSALIAILIVRQSSALTLRKPEVNKVAYSKLTIYTNLKCNVIASTIALILAVDFSVFPRQFAKTERFGLGIMDVGAILFVIINSMVSIEIRDAKSVRGGSALIQTCRSCWSIVLIGLLRMITVKALDYQESVTEYGVHLNFFLLLACVKVSALRSSFFT
jgi:phosphatidylinositol glycan class W